MNLSKSMTIIFLTLLLLWVGSAIYVMQQDASTPDTLKSEANHERSQAAIEYQTKLRALEQDYDKKKHIATGKTVFDRIYNTQEQTIFELIQRLADETLPETWSSEVKVEEFTHFILLIYLPHNSQDIAPDKVASHLGPILEYADWLLTDLAVFDRTHKSYLFFDKKMLNEIRKDGRLSNKWMALAEKQGQSFTRFNSVTIECDKEDSHLIVPISVAGPTGTITSYALLDTGASTTTIQNSTVTSTGADNLQTASHRDFRTANGVVSRAIVTRTINVGGIQRRIEIAVDPNNQISLLGVNFFEGMDYIIDSKNSAIYVWEK